MSVCVNCIYSGRLKSATFYHSFQFPLHGNYQLVFSRLRPTKNLLKRKKGSEDIQLGTPKLDNLSEANRKYTLIQCEDSTWDLL